MRTSILDIAQEYNRLAVSDFEGFTPSEMHGLLYAPFEPSKSCMRLNKKVNEDKLSSPYFTRDVKSYLNIVRSLQPIKLTAKGNLPRQLCRDLLAKGIGEDDFHWPENWKLMKEEDSFYITLINNYTQLVGITKKVKGHLSITRIGDNLLEAPPLDFYLFLFETYCSKLNWGCSDRYPEGGIIQASFPFSIYLVQKYGDQKRSPVFYAEKIIRAYPRSLMDFKGGYSTKEDEILKCYCTRVLERFMKRFGLITIVGQDDWIYMIRKEYTIQKNELMDELITWEKDASTRIG